MHASSPLNAVEWWFEHRVSYGETDAMGYLYYAEYLHLFERARGAFIRSRGMSYADIEQHGIMLPVREARCRYRSPARYDDMLRIRVIISELGRASLTFMYDVYAAEGKTLHAAGMTQHACIDAVGRRPVAMPGWLNNLLSEQKT